MKSNALRRRCVNSIMIITAAVALTACAKVQETKSALQSDSPTETTFGISILEGKAGGPQQPSQPKSGPAGSNYPHKSYKRTDLDFGPKGDANTIVEIREPAEPTPAKAPVIIYIHGWTTPELIEEGRFSPFVEHATKHGYITLLVRYGTRAQLPLHMKNQAQGVKEALEYLNTKGTVKPNGQVAYTGSSLGGSYVFQLAHNAEKLGIPVPKVIGSFDPAGGFVVNIKNLKNIPSSTRVVIVPSESETVPAGGQAYSDIWKSIAHIDASKKLIIMPLNDDHGSPKIYSNHSSCINGYDPGSRDQLEVSAEDWYGCWKPVLGAIDYEFGLGGFQYIDPKGEEVRNMGTWADGTPVKKARINEEVIK